MALTTGVPTHSLADGYWRLRTVEIDMNTKRVVAVFDAHVSAAARQASPNQLTQKRLELPFDKACGAQADALVKAIYMAAKTGFANGTENSMKTEEVTRYKRPDQPYTAIERSDMVRDHIDSFFIGAGDA